MTHRTSFAHTNVVILPSAIIAASPHQLCARQANHDATRILRTDLNGHAKVESDAVAGFSAERLRNRHLLPKAVVPKASLKTHVYYHTPLYCISVTPLYCRRLLTVVPKTRLKNTRSSVPFRQTVPPHITSPILR